MKKIGLSFTLATIFCIFAVSIAFALPQNRGIEKAKEVSPAINEEGQIVAPPAFVDPVPESQLQKVIFIRYAPGKAPKPCDYDGVCEPEEGKWCADCKQGGNGEKPSACYGFLSGAKPKWNWIEDYYYSTADLGNSAALAVSIWEAATSGNIFGIGFSGSYNWGTYDGKNAILYGNYSNPNVIAVTAIWYRGKNIYEYDILFDINYFPGDGSVDLDSVVLHEFGHAAGLDDLYDELCVDEVMYGYYLGEKMTLGDGDKTGIQILYGP